MSSIVHRIKLLFILKNTIDSTGFEIPTSVKAGLKVLHKTKVENMTEEISALVSNVT